MKKYLAIVSVICIMFALLTPCCAAEQSVQSSEVRLSFESESELGNIRQWDITATHVEDGVHGTNGAIQVTTKGASGGVQWQQYLKPGDLYNASAWIKPLDCTVDTVNLILLTETIDEEGNTGSGWEEIPLKAGETTSDGYMRFYVDNYRISERAYPGSNKAPVAKKAGAVSKVVIRVPQKNVTYLQDETYMEPVEKYICYEDFDTKVNKIDPIFDEYDTTKDAIRATSYTAYMMSHKQSKYVAGKNGYAYIAGSLTQGAFFENVTLEPLKVYRLTAEVTGISGNTSNMVEASVGGFVKLYETKNSAIIKTGTLISPEMVTIPKGETRQISYLFRTGSVTSDDYMDTGITVNRIGVCSNGATYALWQVNHMALEEVTDLPYGGDMENLTTLTENCENTRGVFRDVYAGNMPVQLFTYGDKYTTLTPVASDESHGDYLNVSFEGGNAADIGNNRRLSILLNLDKNETYRLSFRAKMSPAEAYPKKTASLRGMYNLGKVDANGLLSGEEGFDSTTASYGYINFADNQVTEEWKEYSATFTVQNRAKTGYLYIGVDEFQPKEGAVLSIDDVKLQNLSSSFVGNNIKSENGKLVVSTDAGKNLTAKTYSLYISENGETFVKADENYTGEFSMKSSYNGKFVKAVLTAKNAKDEKVTAETNVLRTEGYAAFIDQTTYKLTANASYYNESGDDVSFTQILAQYDETGKMVAIKAEGSVSNESVITCEKHPSAALAKSFIWETTGSLKPVSFNVETAVKQPGPSLKILGIGNSYTADSMHYYYQIAKEAGAEDLTLAYLYYGGCTLQQHVEFYDSNAANYTLYQNTNGTWTNTTSKTFLDGLKLEDWDVIVLQQQSQRAAIASSFDPYLNQLIDIVNENKTNPDAKLYWNMTWAYEEGFSNLGSLGTQENMYNCIVDNVQNIIVPNKNIEVVIPTGTAVQNARNVLGDTLNVDGTHLSYDTGRYVAALTWVKSTLGLSVEDVTYVPASYASTLTPEVVAILKKAANDAVSNPYSVTR